MLRASGHIFLGFGGNPVPEEVEAPTEAEQAEVDWSLWLNGALRPPAGVVLIPYRAIWRRK